MKKSRKQPGVCFKGKKAEISVWAPEATSVSLVISKTYERISLAAREYGYWGASTYKLHPDEHYLFCINDEKLLPDPASLSQPSGIHGPSCAVDLSGFNWTDTGWENHPLSSYIFYELHTGTFTDEGTFAGISKKLDHLVELGITAVELMPVASFPGERNWGYDGVFPYAVQESYGGATGLRQLVDECHKRGLAVVLDVVYNHIGPEGNYLGSYGPYFTNKYKTPWGDAINYDDAWCDGVRDFFICNALMWLRDFHIDALRLDAIHAIRDFGAMHFLRELREEVDQLMIETGRVHYLVAESDLNDNRVINPTARGGYGMDSQWLDEFHHAMRVAAGNKREGYYADFNGVEHLAKAYKDAYVYDGLYSPHRLKTFGNKATENAGKQFIVFSQNHDQVGNRMLGERTTALVSFEMLKLLAGATIVSPFLPLLFMGEEWAETNPFQYFISHTDPALVEAVRKGRKEEFAAFHNEGMVPDPYSAATFLQSKLQWDLKEEEQHATMFRYYKALIQLRKTQPAFTHISRKVNVTCDKKREVLVLFRSYKEQHLACLMNFSPEPQTISIAGTQQWYCLFDSASPDWNGPRTAPATIITQVTIQPESILIYNNSYV